jgi:anti-sigma-K factor RskA
MSDERPIGVEERDLDDFALESLAEAYATPPPSGLRERVMGTVSSERSTAAARRTAMRWRVVGALAATVALAFAGLLARERGVSAERLAALRNAETMAAQLTAQLETQGRTVAGLREALAAQVQVLRVMGGPRTLSASLAPTEGHGGAGRLHVDPSTGEGAVVLAGVGTLPPGKVYELWAIRGDKPPEPAGLLQAAGDDVVLARVSGVARPNEVTAFAVSIEPAGGSTSPTGPVVLAGAVQG